MTTKAEQLEKRRARYAAMSPEERERVLAAGRERMKRLREDPATRPAQLAKARKNATKQNKRRRSDPKYLKAEKKNTAERMKKKREEDPAFREAQLKASKNHYWNVRRPNQEFEHAMRKLEKEAEKVNAKQ